MTHICWWCHLADGSGIAACSPVSEAVVGAGGASGGWGDGGGGQAARGAPPWGGTAAVVGQRLLAGDQVALALEEVSPLVQRDALGIHGDASRQLRIETRSVHGEYHTFTRCANCRQKHAAFTASITRTQGVPTAERNTQRSRRVSHVHKVRQL